MKKLIGIFLLLGAMIACQNSSSGSNEKSLEEIKSGGEASNASIVRNPVSASDELDTVNVAKIVFEESSYDFGEVKEGEVITKVFNFTNEGKVPLVISHARSTCGCTVPSWPKEPISPGESGEIEVKFNTKNKQNEQSKPITVTANTYPANTQVFLKGFVKPAKTENEAVANQ